MKTALGVLILFAGLPLAALAGPLTVVVEDSAGKPVADAVVSVESEAAAAKAAGKTATIEQKGLKFQPLVTVVQTGTTILFPNNDKVRHHIYSFSPAHKFDQKLYSGTSATPQVFDKPGLVVMGCNIHDRMVAYVKVVDTPMFGKTDANGKVTIEVGPGRYAVKVWHFNQQTAASDLALNVKGAEALPALNFKLAMKAPVVESDLGGY